MSNVQITSGSVEYTKPSNYQANIAGAKVSLSFAVADGTPHDDAVAMLDAVATLAISKAVEMSNGTVLGNTAAPAPAVDAPASTNAVVLPVGAVVLPVGAAAEGPQVIPPTTHNGPTVVRPYGAPSPATSAPTSETVSIPSAPTAALPAQPAPFSSAPAALPPPAVFSPGAAPAAAAPPAEIADTVLSDKVMEKLIGTPEPQRPVMLQHLHKLTAYFVPPPQKAYAIPQERRQEFLDMLGLVTADAGAKQPYDVA